MHKPLNRKSEVQLADLTNVENIYNIFKEYKYKLALIYFFVLIAELSMIIQPYLLGKSIDGLIEGTWLWMILLSISYFISNLFN